MLNTERVVNHVYNLLAESYASYEVKMDLAYQALRAVEAKSFDHLYDEIVSFKPDAAGDPEHDLERVPSEAVRRYMNEYGITDYVEECIAK